MGSVGRHRASFVLLLARRIKLRFDFQNGKVDGLSEDLWNKTLPRKLNDSFGHFFLSVHQLHSCCGNHPWKCSVIFTVSSEILVLLTRALRWMFLGNGSYPCFPPAPAAAKQTSHKELLQDQEEFFVSGNEWKKNSPKKSLSSELPLTLLVWGREIRAWMFWLEARKFITSAIYCDCNFLGVCCVLQTAPSWFCSKCIKRNPLCFVIVFTPASHHLKIT